MRYLLLTLVGLQVLLGNVCLMQVAEAASAPAPVTMSELHDDAPCAAHASKQTPEKQQSPCQNGHCFLETEAQTDTSPTLEIQTACGMPIVLPEMMPLIPTEEASGVVTERPPIDIKSSATILLQ